MREVIIHSETENICAALLSVVCLFAIIGLLLISTVNIGSNNMRSVYPALLTLTTIILYSILMISIFIKDNILLVRGNKKLKQ